MLRLDNLIDSLLRRRGASKNILNDGSRVAQLNWDYANGDAMKELWTNGFLTMTFPTIFINGSCDVTIANLRNVKYDEFVKHIIYYNIDNRVSQHSFLKFVLLNLGLRRRALSQGSFVVAQELNDAHLSISDLRQQLEDDNNTVPRKIISISSNLPNTHPFWRERRRELDSIFFFRLMEYGDMPAYFDTMSCAEYHCVPLLDILIKYFAKLNGLEFNTVKEKVCSDNAFRRSLVLQNLHIVTTYINYYKTIMKEIFSCPDALHKVVNEIRERNLQRNKRILAPIDLENEEREDGYFRTAKMDVTTLIWEQI